MLRIVPAYWLAQLLALPAAPGQFEAAGLDLVARLDFATTPILIALTLAAATVAAALSYQLVELPFLRRKEPRRRRGAAVG